MTAGCESRQYKKGEGGGDERKAVHCKGGEAGEDPGRFQQPWIPSHQLLAWPALCPCTCEVRMRRMMMMTEVTESLGKKTPLPGQSSEIGGACTVEEGDLPMDL